MPSPIDFNATYYLNHYPDVAQAVSTGVTTPLGHFINFGAFEGRDPNAFFDTSYYLDTYPDVAASGLNPLTHFLQLGAEEGRFPNPRADAFIDADGDNHADEFDAAAYLDAYPDVARALGAGAIDNAFEHYIKYGQFEGRQGPLVGSDTPIDGPIPTDPDGGDGDGPPGDGGGDGDQTPGGIAAFDNADTATVNGTAETEEVDLGSQDYTSLNLLDGVLGPNDSSTDTVRFSVEDGHTLDADFTYDSTLSAGLLGDYDIVVQELVGGDWIGIGESGQSSILDVNLLGGDIVAEEQLDAGTYRAFVTYDGGVLGLSLGGTLDVSGTDTDFTGATIEAANGNVITDPNGNGDTDTVTATTRVSAIEHENQTLTVTAQGSTSIDGDYGTLQISANGSYTYTPDSDTASIGQIDTFEYSIRDAATGEVEMADLTITIDGMEVMSVQGASDTGDLMM